MPEQAPPDTGGRRGMTPREVAAYLRISADRVRAMIARGELGAIDTSPNRCGRARFVVLPEHLAAFEKARRVTPPPKPAPRRKRRPTGYIDYYP
jgi:excisionase family DNA binding protein